MVGLSGKEIQLKLDKQAHVKAPTAFEIVEKVVNETISDTEDKTEAKITLLKNDL